MLMRKSQLDEDGDKINVRDHLQVRKLTISSGSLCRLEQTWIQNNDLLPQVGSSHFLPLPTHLHPASLAV